MCSTDKREPQDWEAGLRGSQGRKLQKSLTNRDGDETYPICGGGPVQREAQTVESR